MLVQQNMFPKNFQIRFKLLNITLTILVVAEKYAQLIQMFQNLIIRRGEQ
jgi:hypothetical protein